MSTNLVVQGERFLAIKEQATIAVNSGFLPNHIKTPEQAIMIALTAAEIGIPPMMAYRMMYVQDGKVSSHTQLQHYMILKNCPGAIIDPVEMTNEVCRIFVRRPGHKGTEHKFTIDDAKKALLLGNPSWQKYPKNMLFNRCMSNIAKSVFPDCIAGIPYTHEELGRNVTTDDDGNIIDVKSDEKYDPENINHKKFLASLVTTTDPNQLREISKQCVGLTLTELTAKLKV